MGKRAAYLRSEEFQRVRGECVEGRGIHGAGSRGDAVVIRVPAMREKIAGREDELRMGQLGAGVLQASANQRPGELNRFAPPAGWRVDPAIAPAVRTEVARIVPGKGRGRDSGENRKGPGCARVPAVPSGRSAACAARRTPRTVTSKQLGAGLGCASVGKQRQTGTKGVGIRGLETSSGPRGKHGRMVEASADAGKASAFRGIRPHPGGSMAKETLIAPTARTASRISSIRPCFDSDAARR